MRNLITNLILIKIDLHVARDTYQIHMYMYWCILLFYLASTRANLHHIATGFMLPHLS